MLPPSDDINIFFDVEQKTKDKILGNESFNG